MLRKLDKDTVDFLFKLMGLIGGIDPLRTSRDSMLAIWNYKRLY